MRTVIDGRLIRSEGDLHELLAAELDFGPNYGKNLDALWDRLSADVPRPLELVWENSEISKNFLGNESFDRISSLLTRVMEQDESFGWTERFTVHFE